MKMKTVCFFEILLSVCEYTQHHNLGEQHQCEIRQLCLYIYSYCGNEPVSSSFISSCYGNV
jgi:hypothetical protein